MRHFYRDAVTAGFDFSQADQVPPAQFNRVLCAGLMGSKPYPALRTRRMISEAAGSRGPIPGRPAYHIGVKFL